jgi:hypothetical protein
MAAKDKRALMSVFRCMKSILSLLNDAGSVGNALCKCRAAAATRDFPPPATGSGGAPGSKP